MLTSVAKGATSPAAAPALWLVGAPWLGGLLGVLAGVEGGALVGVPWLGGFLGPLLPAGLGDVEGGAL